MITEKAKKWIKITNDKLSKQLSILSLEFNFFGYKPPGVQGIERLFAKFLISTNEYSILSANFLRVVEHIGQYAAGDEKLLHTLGTSADIRVVMSKPDRVGFGFYEVVVVLKNNKPLIIYLKLQHTQFVDNAHSTFIIPAWWHYCLMYAPCDHFNRRINMEVAIIQAIMDSITTLQFLAFSKIFLMSIWIFMILMIVIMKFKVTLLPWLTSFSIRL
jgi:hypothetical protein